MRNKTVALILSILFGGLGIDRFYLGYIGMGIFKLLTGGGFLVLWVLDIINIANGNLRPADGSEYEDAPSSSTQADEAYEKLERLSRLYEQGVLSDEEYTRMKEELMEKM